MSIEKNKVRGGCHLARGVFLHWRGVTCPTAAPLRWARAGGRPPPVAVFAKRPLQAATACLAFPPVRPPFLHPPLLAPALRCSVRPCLRRSPSPPPRRASLQALRQ